MVNDLKFAMDDCSVVDISLHKGKYTFVVCSRLARKRTTLAEQKGLRGKDVL
jgi:hypothetical protein